MYHFHASYISRSSEGSACAHAAYISASRIHDDRTGDTWDYTKKKREVLHTTILAPEGSPEWIYDGETLWNAVEIFEDFIAEKRFKGHPDPVKNAKSLAAKEKFLSSCKTQYKADIALPLEIKDPQHLIKLSEQLINECYVKEGLIVHYAIHLKKGNPHLHIAATPRAMDVSQQHFKNIKHAIEKPKLAEMRQKVAEIGNAFALAHGYNFRWDHRSYKDQGIEIVPTRKRGWAAEKLEKMGGVSRILSENQEIRQKNIELLLEKPEDLIRLVAHRKAVFTRQDLEEEILKRVGGDAVLFGVLRDKVAGVKIASSAVISKTVNNNWSGGRKASDSPVYDSQEALRSVSSWTAQVLGHEEAVAIGETLRGEKVYTSQSYQQMEKEIEGYVKQLRAEQISPVAREVKKHALKKIEQQKGFSFSKEQKGAVDHLLSSCRLEVLTGQAGTGKTTILKPVVEAYRQAGYEIIGTSFQGKVADMLSRELGIRGLNIDQLRYRWKEHERYKAALSEGTLRGKALLEARKGLKRYASSRLTSNHVVIVDEGNMVNAPLWQALLKEVTSSGAILRVVEDNRQIKTLFGGDIARLIEEKSGAYTLTQVRRQKVKWMQDASTLLNAHQVEEGLRRYQEQERLQFHDSLDGAKWGIVADYLNGIEEDAKASRVILTFRNSEVKEINAAIRERLKDKGLLGREFEMVLKDTESVSGVKTLRLAVGERIFFTVNDATEWHVKTLKANGSVGQGVRNGTPGIIEDYDEKRKTMKVRLEDGRLVGFDTRSYSSLTYGYAITINKAEGETYTYSHVLFDPLMNANSLLIAMTRHERDCQVRISRTHAEGLKEMVQATERGSYRGVLSDYTIASEDKRWFDLAQSYARKVMETGVLAAQIASQKEGQEPTPQTPASSSGASILQVSSSPEAVASSQDDLSSQMEKAVRDRESLAKEVLSQWDDYVPYLLASGFTRSQIEIHAGVRQRLLSEVEQVALQRVEDYRKIACEARKAWLDIKEACPVKVLAFQHEGWSRFEALRERRAELAYEIAGHPALHRPFFKVKASEQEGIPVYTTMGGKVYGDRPSSFKTALKHGDEYISRQRDSAYVSLLSPSEQQSYGEALRLRDLMRSCAGLYRGWQDAQQNGVIPQAAEGALRRLHEVRRERDLLAYRMMTSGKDYTPFLEKLSIDSVAMLKHAASGEVRLLCLKREHVRTVEERVEMSVRLLGFVTKGQEQASLTTEQKGWIMVMKEHGITSDHLRFEAGYSHYLREGKTSLYTDIKALKAAWEDMEAYRKTHRESAKRWEILKTWSTAYVQGLQEGQVRALNLLPDTKTFLVRVNMEDKAMARLQEKVVNPRILAAVTTEIRQVAGGLASFSDLGEEIKARQGELTHLQSHLRRGRSGYLSLFREQRGETLGYEDLRHKKLEQAWHVIDKSSPIIEGLFNKGHMLEAARLQKEAHEFATWEKVKSLSRLKGEEKAQVCHQLWEQSQQEGLEGKSFVKGALVKKRVSFDRLCLYSLAYQHVKAGEMKEQGISLYTPVESYLDAKENFSALWKRRQENIEGQLAEVKETYEQKREDVICVLEEKNIKGSIPYQVDRLIDSLVPDKAGEIRISAREKTAAFVVDRGIVFDEAGVEKLSLDIVRLRHSREAVHKERLKLLGKPDKEMIEAVSERNQTACHLLDSSLGDKLRASEERVLVFLVEYGQKGALRQGSRKERYPDDPYPSISLPMRLPATDSKEIGQDEATQKEDLAVLQIATPDMQGRVQDDTVQEKERLPVPDPSPQEQKTPKTEKVRAQREKPYRASFTPKEPRYSVDEALRNLTAKGVEDICYSLLGKPNRTSNRSYLRYGHSHGLAINLTPSKLGLWNDHRCGEGGDIFKLVEREKGCPFREALIYVAEILRVPPERSPHQVSYASSSADDEKADARRIQTMKRYVNACQPIKGTLAERYLREHRGIQGALPADMRFIPAMRNYYDENSYHIYPALAVLGRDKTGEIRGLQVVFLNKDTARKADCEIQKKSFGMLKGAYVPIQKGEGAVFLAEGIETALSVKEAGVKGDIYAVLGGTNFRNAPLFLEDKTRPLIICADQDGEGTPSAKALEKTIESLKEEGFRVSVIRPELAQGLGDFNDVLKREGVEGVRKYFKGHLQDDLPAIKQEPALKDVLMSGRHDKNQDIKRENAQALEETGKGIDDSSIQKDRPDVQQTPAGKEPASDPVHHQLRPPAEPQEISQEKAAVERLSTSLPSEKHYTEREQKILAWLQASIEGDSCHEGTKKYYLELAQEDPEGTFPRWQSIINDYSFDPDREGKVFSDRDQRILDYLEKSIQEGDYLQNTKEYYLKKAHENPEETLHYWKEFTREFSFDPDAHEHLQTSLSVTEVDSVVQSHSSENSRELIHHAYSLLETVRDILPEEAFKKFEASLSDKPEEMTASCQAVIISHQETLRLEDDVSTFIELAEKTCESRVIFSGEIRTILPVLERIVEERQDDEQFAERLKASGHRVAFEIFNSHVDDLKDAQIRGHGYGFEI